jgi:hypothetical protein
MRMIPMFVTCATVVVMGCADSGGYCPEPELDAEPHTCQFYQGHAEVVPDLLCRVSNALRDPILTSGATPVLKDTQDPNVIWVPAMRRLDDDGQTCGVNYGVIQSQQYRPGWTPAAPDCVWVACSAFAAISESPAT